MWLGLGLAAELNLFVLFQFLQKDFINANALDLSSPENCIEPADMDEIGAALLEEYMMKGINVTFPALAPDDNVNNFEVLGKDAIGRACAKDLEINQKNVEFTPLIVLKDELAPKSGIRATCPWKYTINTSPTRVPKHIAEATCICNECGSDTYTRTFRRTRHSRGRNKVIMKKGKCQPVTAPVLVYRKRCDTSTHTFQYYLDTEQVSIGCRCAYDI